ncbi:unnamed protein product [Cuscuta campestris]|uniref:Uncharacterized protein n=1 Tax=Cuscuta campestris TaxID=132261 RepID=A0A484N2E9_9ASTE|nr:unnamed protein product [Cuscuta campestris]
MNWYHVNQHQHLRRTLSEPEPRREAIRDEIQRNHDLRRAVMMALFFGKANSSRSSLRQLRTAVMMALL